MSKELTRGMSTYLPVQAPVLDRLGEVLLADMLATLKIGDGPGHLEDSGEGAGGEAEAVGDQFQHPVAGGVQFAVLPEVAGGHLGGLGRHSFSIHVPLEKRPVFGYPVNPITVGDHIRKRRMDLGLLKREVADIIGIT